MGSAGTAVSIGLGTELRYEYGIHTWYPGTNCSKEFAPMEDSCSNPENNTCIRIVPESTQ